MGRASMGANVRPDGGINIVGGTQDQTTAANVLTTALADLTLAESNGTISGNATALTAVQQVGTDLAAMSLSASIPDIEIAINPAKSLTLHNVVEAATRIAGSMGLR